MGSGTYDFLNKLLPKTHKRLRIHREIIKILGLLGEHYDNFEQNAQTINNLDFRTSSNDIGIYRNKENGKTTVAFWIFRNFFNSPSTHFVFTDDPIEIQRIEDNIKSNPIVNWKIRENWYRTIGE